MTAGTLRRRDGRGLDEDGTYPVQQGEDAIPSGFAGGTAPAVITHALKTLGQDMLEQAPQELLAGQSGAVLDALVVAVAEGDALRCGAFNLAFVQGRAIKIVRTTHANHSTLGAKENKRRKSFSAMNAS